MNVGEGGGLIILVYMCSSPVLSKGDVIVAVQFSPTNRLNVKLQYCAWEGSL